MRKNSVRKWLHAILDLLPLFVIPIFAIYTRNENYNSNIEINIQEAIYYETNDPSTEQDLTIGNVYRWTDNYTADTSIINMTFINVVPHVSIDERFNIDITYNGAAINVNQQGRVLLQLFNNGAYLMSFQIGGETFDFVLENYNTNAVSYFLPHLTYTNVKYLKGYNTTTYNDTDVGSQFVYTLYNTVDKYFNCTNLFNLEQVWNWVQLNLFGGNAPLMVYVVWQVIVYEFFMDLIFLLYSVFMFIIDFATNTLERFYRRSC